jgi:hypothetical protein
MDQLDVEMLHIMSMDPGAYVGFSDYSKSWYVHLNLGEKLEGGSCSIPTHAPTPAGAVHTAFDALVSVDKIVKRRTTDEEEYTLYRWNGACFAVVPVSRDAQSDQSCD